MKPSEALAIHRVALRRLLNRYGFARPRVFGSVLTKTDTEESDLDVLVLEHIADAAQGWRTAAAGRQDQVSK
jgi:predicted nucleotidyltransferase